MKINILVFCLAIFISYFASDATNYQFQTLTNSFKDITHYENHVIVYGSDNLIKYSSDFGNNWENKYLENVVRINFIKVNKDNIDYIDYIVNDSLYLYSNDLISKPQLQKLIRNKRFTRYSSNNEYIVFAYDSAVDIYSKNDFSVKTIPLISKIPPLIFANGKTLLITNSSEKLKEYNFESASFINEFADSCTNCRDITNLQLVSNKIIVQRQFKGIANNSYYFSLDNSTKEQIELGTYLRGYVFDVKPKVLGQQLSIVADSIRYHNYILPSGLNEIDEYFFSTYQVYDKEMKKISDNSSNYFNEKITSAAKLSNGNVLVVGNNNAIFLSKDNGLTWETKMSLTNVGLSFLTKNKDKLILNDTWKGIITESIDNGITWKNQNRYDEDFRAKPLTSIIDTNNRKLTYLFIDSTFKESMNKDLEFTYTKKNINFSDYKNLESFNINVATEKYNVFSFNKGFQFSKNAEILFFDKDNNLVKNVRLDSIAVLKMFINDTSNFKLLIGERKQIKIDTASGYRVLFGNSKTKLIETKNGGLSWIVLDVLDSTIDNVFSEIKSITDNTNLMLANYTQFDLKNSGKYNKSVYVLNIKDDKISVVYYDIFNETKQRSLFFINQFKNNYILSCEQYFLKLDANFKVIDTILLPKGRAYLQSVNLDDKLLMLSNGNILSYFKETPTNSVESEIADERPSYLYLYNPYPIPARTYVKTQIAWDMRFDIQKADIEIYDVNGCLVMSKDKNLEIKPTDQYAGTLVWNITDDIQSGFYLIKINYFGTQKVIPIIVSK